MNAPEKQEFYQFFCAMHKLQICSRDQATAILAVTNGNTVHDVKRTQQRYDDFRDAVYVYIQKVYQFFKAYKGHSNSFHYL